MGFLAVRFDLITLLTLDSPDQTHFSDIAPSGLARTIITDPKSVKCSPIGSIAPLSWGNYSLAKPKSSGSTALSPK